jgi:hypothetical protein
MSYYSEPHTITEEMLKHIVADENALRIKNLEDKLEKMYADTDDDEYDEDSEYLEFHKLREDIEFLKKEISKHSMPNWHDMEEDDTLQKKWMMKVINAGLFKPKHGDGFHWLGDGYRNQGLWFWDDKNKRIIPPYTEIDDYGGVPPRFLVGNGDDQFAPNNWENIVDHNSFVFLAPELVEEIKSNAKSVTKIHKYDNKEHKIWHTSIMIKDNAYAVQIHLDDISKIDNVFSYHDGKLVKEY